MGNFKADYQLPVLQLIDCIVSKVYIFINKYAYIFNNKD